MPRLRRMALLALLACAACKIYGGQKKGETGALGFYEPNAYPADKTTSGIGFERPIALGARADAWVLAPGISNLSSATIDDPEIVSLSFSSYPIILRGKSEGTTTLRVSTTTASDRLAISVVKADGARLWVPDSSPLISFATPDTFFGKGAAYRAGASVRVAAEPLAGSRALLGFDLFQWSVDPPSLATGSSDGSTVNTQRFTAMGEGGVARISTQLGGSHEIVTLSSSEVPTLKIYRAVLAPEVPVELAALEPQDVANFLLGVTDAMGHYVVPGPQDRASFQAEISSGSVPLLEAKLSGHVVSLRACTGVGNLRLRYLGAELSIPIAVTAEVADKECPQI